MREYNKNAFRTDINGLRAIAVAAVVLFHFNVLGFQGGFIGVDIFFVISGYLMTNIIFTKLEAGQFSLSAFYLDRARRIVPALAALCITLLIICSAFLLPSAYRALGKHAAGSMSFISNVLFWREAGYFDTASHTKWLLHTWSLSVEWQFYIFYPLAILALRRFLSPAKIKLSLFLITVASLALSIYFSDPQKLPTAAFYLLPTRAWEMLTGGLVFLFPINKPGRERILESSGFALIVFSIFSFNEKNAWPGSLALVPVIGTALVIAASRFRSLVTGNRIAQFVGKISYSTYLWHWPLVVILHLFRHENDTVCIALSIAASLVLGYISFTTVENTMRRVSSTDPLPWLKVSAIAACVTTLAVTVIVTKGVPSRFSPAVVLADAEQYNSNPNTTKCHWLLDPCDVAKAQLVRHAIMFGDSHAEAVAEALAEAAPKRAPDNILLVAMQGCPTIAGTRRSDIAGKCYEFNEKYLPIFASETKSRAPIVIVNGWTGYLSQASGPKISFVDNSPAHKDMGFSKEELRKRYIETVCVLAKHRKVYVVKPIPTFSYNVPQTLAEKLYRDPKTQDLSVDLEHYKRVNALIIDVMEDASRQCGVAILDPTEYLCRGGKCLGSFHGRPLYIDDTHLSEYGNRFLLPMFRKVYQ